MHALFTKIATRRLRQPGARGRHRRRPCKDQVQDRVHDTNQRINQQENALNRQINRESR